MIKAERIYYVYVYYYPDRELNKYISSSFKKLKKGVIENYDGLIPMYVGKGTGDRYKKHWWTIENGKDHEHNIILNARLKRILDLKKQPVIKKVYKTKDEKDAYRKEVELIKKYRGLLGDAVICNQIEGGEWKGYKNY